MTEKEFKCEKCGRTFLSEWSEEEALAERDRDFPDTDPDDFAVVCDDCYQQFTQWRKTQEGTI